MNEEALNEWRKQMKTIRNISSKYKMILNISSFISLFSGFIFYLLSHYLFVKNFEGVLYYIIVISSCFIGLIIRDFIGDIMLVKVDNELKEDFLRDYNKRYNKNSSL